MTVTNRRDRRLSPVPTLIYDDFTDNTFDGGLWQRSSATDILEQNGRMEGRQVHAWGPVQLIDFTGGWLQFESEVDVWIRMYFPGFVDSFEWRVTAASIRALRTTSGGGVDLGGTPVYNQTTYAYKGFRHCETNNKLYFLYGTAQNTMQDFISAGADMPPGWRNMRGMYLQWIHNSGATLRWVDNVMGSFILL